MWHECYTRTLHTHTHAHTHAHTLTRTHTHTHTHTLTHTCTLLLVPFSPPHLLLIPYLRPHAHPAPPTPEHPLLKTQRSSEEGSRALKTGVAEAVDEQGFKTAAEATEQVRASKPLLGSARRTLPPSADGPFPALPCGHRAGTVRAPPATA